MIVMKFGGASLASLASIRRVASIVQSQVHRNPIVIVSAIGDTTDQLLAILEHASRAQSYLAWKLQEEVKTYHFCLAEDLLGPEQLEPIDRYIRQTFRDLHVRMLEVCEGESSVTPELRDWVAGLGEKLSSRMAAAAFQQHGLNATHLDSTKLILTDENFTNAAPRYWETYARIRWAVPLAARTHVVVLGGFIGATEDGRATTLGRGGSDLTASIVGAAVNAEEIQVWKDVDGVLTWDPKIKSGGYRLTSVSYEEATELAQAGATILHPETIGPAQRLRIPVIIRNTFRPDGEGTRIGITKIACTNPVKSIVCKTNMTVVELRSPGVNAIAAEYYQELERICREQKAATLLAVSDEVIYLALDSGRSDPGATFALDRCVEAHVRTGQAIITLVGQTSKRCNVVAHLCAVLPRRSALILPQDGESCSVRVVVAQEELAACLEILRRTFFTQVDQAFFASIELAPEQRDTRSPEIASEERQSFGVRTGRFALPGMRP
ncbi:MAG TPA: aspartate kinase [Bryobacteraceae bacterium]|nr:aspartate kinase [Bryobacteraceae bacterium]